MSSRRHSDHHSLLAQRMCRNLNVYSTCLTVSMLIRRLICQSECRVLVQTPDGILRLHSILSSSNSRRSIVVLFLDFPSCCSRARVPGHYHNSHSHRSFRFRKWDNAAGQLQQGSRLFPIGQFRIYLCFISGVCDCVAHRAWSRMA